MVGFKAQAEEWLWVGEKDWLETVGVPRWIGDAKQQEVVQPGSYGPSKARVQAPN